MHSPIHYNSRLEIDNQINTSPFLLLRLTTHHNFPSSFLYSKQRDKNKQTKTKLLHKKHYLLNLLFPSPAQGDPAAPAKRPYCRGGRRCRHQLPGWRSAHSDDHVVEGMSRDFPLFTFGMTEWMQFYYYHYYFYRTVSWWMGYFEMDYVSWFYIILSLWLFLLSLILLAILHTVIGRSFSH